MKNISVILVNPQLPENIGMAIRACVNTGILDVRIVNPKQKWPNEKGAMASAESVKYLKSNAVYNNLQSAIADLHIVYATSARKRDMIKKVIATQIAAKNIHQNCIDGKKIGIMFGGEKDGLLNEDIVFADSIITISDAGIFSSYNLAQAVLVVCYDILKKFKEEGDAFVFQKNQDSLSLQENGLITNFNQPIKDLPTDQWITNFNRLIKNDDFKKEQFECENFMHLGKTKIATVAQIDEMLDLHIKKLIDLNYFPSEEKKISMTNTIRSFFSRTSITMQEIQSLNGMFNALYYKNDCKKSDTSK